MASFKVTATDQHKKTDSKVFTIRVKRSLGMAKESPASSCMAIKTLKTGVYWLKNSKNEVFQTFCDNDNTDGGWSYAASFSASGSRSEWNYYSSHWVNENSQLRESLLSPYSNDKNNVKTKAFNGVEFNEVLITDAAGKNYIVVNELNKGNDKTFKSLTSIFQGCYKENNRQDLCHLYGNRKAQNGGGQWNSPHWAFNNIEW